MEKIKTLQALYDSAYSQIKGQYNSCSGYFITIDEQDIVEEWRLIADTIFENVWTIGFIHNHYESYGHYNVYRRFATINKEGGPVNKISKAKWTMSKINFNAVRDGAKPVPVISFYMNYKPEDVLELTFYTAREFKDVWKFFLEIEEHCNTLEEAQIYQKFFEHRSENKQMQKTLAEFKQELKEKDDVIMKYKDLITKIEALVNSTATN